MNEKGYELYQQPRGTKIFNNEASERYVERATEKLINKLLQGNKQGDTNINIYNPQSSPAELARQIKKSQQELALGF